MFDANDDGLNGPTIIVICGLLVLAAEIYVCYVRVERDFSVAINADPQVSEGVGATGRNHYYLDSDSTTTHVNATQPATVSDPPIGQ